MSNGPLPSKLTLLSNLPSCDFGDKVRFLGWCVLPAQCSAWHASAWPFGAVVQMVLFLLLGRHLANQGP